VKDLILRGGQTLAAVIAFSTIASAGGSEDCDPDGICPLDTSWMSYVGLEILVANGVLAWLYSSFMLAMLFEVVSDKIPFCNWEQKKEMYTLFGDFFFFVTSVIAFLAGAVTISSAKGQGGLVSGPSTPLALSSPDRGKFISGVTMTFLLTVFYALQLCHTIYSNTASPNDVELGNNRA